MIKVTGGLYEKKLEIEKHSGVDTFNATAFFCKFLP